MKDDKKYWEDIVSSLYEEGNVINGEGEKFKSDDHWAKGITTNLKKVFVWDLFDKTEARKRLNSEIGNERKPKLHLLNTVWFRAAVIIFAVLSGFLINSMTQDGIQQKFTEINVPPGQMTQIKLSDGTKIWLNSGSTFKYPNEFDKKSRDVYLSGEAYLEVAKNKRKPFNVITQKLAVEVLGTSFNVNAYDDDKEASVALVEGSIMLHSADDKWTKEIIPGQVATVVGNKLSAIGKTNPEFYTSWTKGEIVFRKEKLQDIATKLERWYNIEIEFADQELKNLQFSGTFLKYKPIEQVLTSFRILDDRFDFVLTERINQKSIIQIKKRE